MVKPIDINEINVKIISFLIQAIKILIINGIKTEITNKNDANNLALL